jgi:hypothetical protein
LAYRPTAPGKSNFDLHYAAKQARSVRDPVIQKGILDFLATRPDELAWKQFCAEFRLKRKDGSDGPRVKYVTVSIGDTNEYKDMSKDGTGAYRKALKGHRGQIVFIDRDGKPRIRPIYVFESVHAVWKKLREEGAKVYGFFRTGCLVKIDKPIPHDTTPLEPGVYRLNTIETIGRARVTSAS